MNQAARTWREAALRRAAMAGDEDAWRSLYTEHARRLYAYLHFRSDRCPERTEELAQEVWSIAVRRLDQFDPARSAFGTWLLGIANNVLRNRQRAAGNGHPVGLDDGDAIVDGEAANDAELAEEIALVLGGLPPRYQEVLRAKYAARQTVAEIADRHGESLKSIESLLSRARAAFRAAYTARNGDVYDDRVNASNESNA